MSKLSDNLVLLHNSLLDTAPRKDVPEDVKGLLLSAANAVGRLPVSLLMGKAVWVIGLPWRRRR